MGHSPGTETLAGAIFAISDYLANASNGRHHFETTLPLTVSTRGQIPLRALPSPVPWLGGSFAHQHSAAVMASPQQEGTSSPHKRHP